MIKGKANISMMDAVEAKKQDVLLARYATSAGFEKTLWWCAPDYRYKVIVERRNESEEHVYNNLQLAVDIFNKAGAR